jgi:hypothetical protein
VIEEAYGQKAEDDRRGRAPEPEVLVQQIKSDDCDNEQGPFHLIVGFSACSIRNRGAKRGVLSHVVRTNCNYVVAVSSSL